MIYENLIKPVLFSFDPETIHHLALGVLKTLSRFPAFLDYFPSSESKSREVFGLQFPNPVGLAAGTFVGRGRGPTPQRDARAKRPIRDSPKQPLPK